LKWVLGKFIHGFHGESSTFKRIQCNYGVGGLIQQSGTFHSNFEHHHNPINGGKKFHMCSNIIAL
jgi:hypothetical protein